MKDKMLHTTRSNMYRRVSYHTPLFLTVQPDGVCEFVLACLVNSLGARAQNNCYFGWYREETIEYLFCYEQKSCAPKAGRYEQKSCAPKAGRYEQKSCAPKALSYLPLAQGIPLFKHNGHIQRPKNVATSFFYHHCII